MKRSPPLLLAALLAAGCTDLPTPPQTVPGTGGPSRAITLEPDGRRVAWKSLAEYTDSAGDWRPALQKAVNEAQNVYIPPGTWLIKSATQRANVNCAANGSGCGSVFAAVRLPSNTRVYGDGPGAVLKLSASTCAHPNLVYRGGVFMAGHTAADSGKARNIIVENLALEHACEASTVNQDGVRKYALWVRRGSNVAFRGNTVTAMGLFENDQYLERNDSYAGVPDGGHPGNLEITGNVGYGRRSRKGYAQSQGILVGYVNGATIADNELRHYLHAIQWWGGNEALLGAGSTRKTSNLTIRGNQSYYTAAGIWGAMGKNILVASNHAEECDDYCIGAEGSDDVTFEHNTARYGAKGGFGVLFTSRNLVFRWNESVHDDQKRMDEFGNRTREPEQAVMTLNARYGTTATIENNRFVYEGASGNGLISKNHARELVFRNNELTNTALYFVHGDQGGVLVQDNRFTFTRTLVAGQAAIDLRNTTGDAGAAAPAVFAGFEAAVIGNRISSSAAQGGVAIRVDQAVEPSPTATDSYVHSNAVRGFATSLELAPAGGDALRRFTVQENGYTGAFPSTWTSYQSLANNVEIDGEPHRIGYAVRGPGDAAWRDERYGGEGAGNLLAAGNLEAFRVRLLAPVATSICYRAFVESGWQGEVCNDAQAGTVGQSKRWKAFKVRLVSPQTGWGVCYQALMSSGGWTAEACNGSSAGNVTLTGTATVQAIRVRLYREDDVGGGGCPDPEQVICG